jgi:uncharacterized protein YqjF (DUF2071 family)
MWLRLSSTTPGGGTSLNLLATPIRQWQGLARRDHRPWPLPRKPWIQGQSWQRLLFVHYRLEPEALSPLLGPGLFLQTFDGSAWLGVTPFRVTGLRLEGTPPLPGLSSFPELNVRTYVTDGTRPGIWFFSLDAGSQLAVRAARRFYHLPNYPARMHLNVDEERVSLRSERLGSRYRACFAANYRPVGSVAVAAPGTLESFLIERYCLYTHDGSALRRAEIHHPAWCLQPAAADVEHQGILPGGIGGLDPPLFHYAHEQHVLVWAPEVVPTPSNRQ